MKFRKKPEVEAIQYVGSNTIEISKFTEIPLDNLCVASFVSKLIINTLEGKMTADVDDWIIKGVKGEFYPCKPDIFEMTYEKVE